MAEAGDEIRAAFKPIQKLITLAATDARGNRNDAGLLKIIEAVQQLCDRQLATELAVDEIDARND